MTIMSDSAGTTTSLNRSGMNLSMTRYTTDRPATPKMTGNTELA